MHQNKNQNKNNQHEPVLLKQVLSYLDPKPSETLLDLTAGYGGHAKAILDSTGSLIRSVLIDRDINAVKQLQEIFPKDKIEIRQQDFYTASLNLVAEDRCFDLILADLGVSSPHLNEGNRGFSINNEGPLDMRMDQSQELTAEYILNNYSEAEIANILYEYGQEPKSKRIAKLIVNSRPINTTSELAAIAKKAWPGHSRVHPATRTFQAVRIAVNDELKLLEQSLPLWIKLLNPGGRIAIISFHSLEDKIVKQYFADHSGKHYDAQLELLTKHPVVADPQEIVYNPRSRSAKLRVAVKIKRKGN
jgi:16S rRNA (cytosine1402-N4)-methyltransferase